MYNNVLLFIIKYLYILYSRIICSFYEIFRPLILIQVATCSAIIILDCSVITMVHIQLYYRIHRMIFKQCIICFIELSEWYVTIIYGKFKIGLSNINGNDTFIYILQLFDQHERSGTKKYCVIICNKIFECYHKPCCSLMHWNAIVGNSNLSFHPFDD